VSVLRIINATVVTCDRADSVIENATITVRDGVIAAIDGSDVGQGELSGETAETVDANGGIVLPGMVNAHAHLAMTLFRGVADGLDLDGFLATVLPIEGAVLTADTVAVGSELAAAECVGSGITSALDMYFFPEAATAAAATRGLRVRTGPVFLSFPGPDERVWDRRLSWAREYLNAQPATERWVCPHSVYLLSEDELRQVAALAEATGARVHVHAAETRAEMAQVATLHGGRTPVAVLADVGLLHDRTVLAHGVHVTDADIDRIAAAGAHVAHNPASNAKLASGVAPVRRLLDAGVNVALGTDGSASANDLDLWMAMRLAGFIAGLVHDDPSELSAIELVRMATINGAKALGLDNQVGSIEVDKRADIVVMRADSATMVPSFDPRSSLAYCASRGDIHHVFVDGRRVDGLVDADLRLRVAEICNRVRALMASEVSS
jgi:5-methylthioadenosine/S-adenosylhomocysteine deaminase